MSILTLLFYGCGEEPANSNSFIENGESGRNVINGRWTPAPDGRNKVLIFRGQKCVEQPH